MADSTVTGRFAAYLRANDLPVTSQRLAVAELMLGAPDHVAAEDIVRRAREHGQKIGQATVYRTIDLLLDSGLLVERDFGEGLRRFEPAREAPRQEQLRCDVCGGVDEFRDDRLEVITQSAARAHGFARGGHHLVINGTCRKCQGTAPATERRYS